MAHMKTRTKNYELIPVRTTAKTPFGVMRAEAIAVKLNNGAGIDYISPNEELLKIFACDEWQISMENHEDRCIRCKCWGNGHDARRKDSVTFLLHNLAYGCYTGQIHAETLIEDITRFQSWKNTRGLTIDHADSNTRNHTALNISLMPRSLNNSKKEVVALFVPPYYLNSIYYDGEYRVQMMYYTTRQDEKGYSNLQATLGKLLPPAEDRKFVQAGRHYLCKDAESYVACLRELYDTHVSWCNPEHTPRTHSKVKQDVDYWAGDIKHSLHAEKVLSLMPSSDFEPYPVKKGGVRGINLL